MHEHPDPLNKEGRKSLRVQAENEHIQKLIRKSPHLLRISSLIGDIATRGYKPDSNTCYLS